MPGPAVLLLFALHMCFCRLEELNEKRQSMVSKLKGVEKELTGATRGAVCAGTHVHGVLCFVLMSYNWFPDAKSATCEQALDKRMLSANAGTFSLEK